MMSVNFNHFTFQVGCVAFYSSFITKLHLKYQLHRNKVSPKTIVMIASCITQIRNTHEVSPFFTTTIKICAFFYAFRPLLAGTILSQSHLIAIPLFFKR
jgi:hypothetical protein